MGDDTDTDTGGRNGDDTGGGRACNVSVSVSVW